MLAQSSVQVRHWLPTWFTSHPVTAREKFINSAVVWLALMALWALTDALTVLFPSGGRPVQPNPWLTHAGFTVAGSIAIWCMHQTGFPAAWDARIPAARRLGIPALAGVVLGILAIAIDQITGASKIIAAQMGSSFNVAFPGSLWVYSGGAIISETIYRLLPIPVLLWLISTVGLRGRGRAQTFWVLALLTSAIEPGISQGPWVLAQTNGALGPGVFATFATYAVHSYAVNFAAAVSFYRYGLLGAVLVRLAYYLIWHVGYGIYLG